MQEKSGPEISAGKKANWSAELFRAIVGDRSQANERLISVIAGVAFGLMAYFFGRCEQIGRAHV